MTADTRCTKDCPRCWHGGDLHDYGTPMTADPTEWMSCWYCAGDPPDEKGPCEACDERVAFTAAIQQLQAERYKLEAENKVLQDELDEAYWALEVFS